MNSNKGGFTLPGESGYEVLTLKLARKWGADCIRDSDGTQLSDGILQSGIPIYSTLCMVRSINGWARQHRNRLQRNFLCTSPVLCEGDSVSIRVLDGFFREQFELCPDDDPYTYWQVYDRTAGTLHKDWTFDAASETVSVHKAAPYHLYTLSFLATRIWEEISMYNHITNGWGDREHLMAVEPRYPDVQEALLAYLRQWLEDHTATRVVRFTSLFYNFVWIWGSDPRQRHLLSDWGSYDFTVNPESLRAFELEYGYRMLAEDFVNMGKYRPAHSVPTKKQRDWMAFTGKFVREFGRKCVDLVHAYNKLAYVFYDDSWIGLEPWSGHFAEFGFDGLIKCVFNAFEARLCAGVAEVKTHELRLHPYLFPTGLNGEPTFAAGGHPDEDARRFWTCVRRALLRVKIDRIGLGGFLHLTENFPKFQDEIAQIAGEFRLLRKLNSNGRPWSTGIRIGILHSWGSLRTWNCSGHMHEHPELPLNHIHEALAGLPLDLCSISLEDAMLGGIPGDIDVVINAGSSGDAWSGGDIWQEASLRQSLNRFVANGGALIGVGEPSAARAGMRYFQTADILGVDREIGETICSGKYAFSLVKDHFIVKDLISAPVFMNGVPGIYALDGTAQVLASNGHDIVLAAHPFAKGRAVYMNGFTYSSENTRLLYRAILWAAQKEPLAEIFTPDNVDCECAYYPDEKKLAVINNSQRTAETTIQTPWGKHCMVLKPQDIITMDMMA